MHCFKYVKPFYIYSMEKVILNAKVDPLLKEAVRLVAVDKSKMGSVVSSTDIIISALERDPHIRKKLDTLKK